MDVTIWDYLSSQRGLLNQAPKTTGNDHSHTPTVVDPDHQKIATQAVVAKPNPSKQRPLEMRGFTVAFTVSVVAMLALVMGWCHSCCCVPPPPQVPSQLITDPGRNIADTVPTVDLMLG